MSGCSKSFDHNSLVHAMWRKFAELQICVWVERVPTAVNIADDPSRHYICINISCVLACYKNFMREEYGLLESLGATKITPQLDDVFTYPETWEHISWASSLAGSQCLEHA